MSAIVNIILEILRALREQASDYIRDLSKNPLQKTRQTLNTLTLLWMLLYGISPYPSPQQQIEQQLGTIERKMEEEPEEAKYGYSWLYRIYNMYRFLHVQPVWVKDSLLSYIYTKLTRTFSDSVTLSDGYGTVTRTLISRTLDRERIISYDSFEYGIEKVELGIVIKERHFVDRVLLGDSVSRAIRLLIPLTLQETLSLSELLSTVTRIVTKNTFSESLALSETFNIVSGTLASRTLSDLFELTDEVIVKKRVPEYPEAEYIEITLSDYLSSLDELDPRTFILKQLKTLIFDETLSISDSGGTGYPYPEEPTKTYMQYKFAETVTLSDLLRTPVEISSMVATTNRTVATSYGFRRCLARTSKGILFVSFARDVNGKPATLVRKSADGGRTWGDEVQLSETGYTAGTAAIIVDYKDHIHAIFSANSSAHPDYLLLYHAEYDGSSWRVEGPLTPDFTRVVDTNVTVDLNGYLHVFFGGVKPDITSYRITYHMIYDGESWSEPQPIIVDNKDHLNPTPVVDSQNRVHLIYGAGQLYHSVFDGTSWSTPVVIASFGYTIFGPSTCIDHNDVIHVVFHGRTSSYPYYQIWYCKYDGTWSSPVRISTASGMENVDQFFPSIAPDIKGRLHVVWYDFNDKIWYCKYDNGWITPTELIPGTTGRALCIRWSNFPSWNRIIDKLELVFTGHSAVRFLSRPIE